MVIAEDLRNFDYDMSKLLGLDNPRPKDAELVMTISGLPGDKGYGTWCGLGNGTHGLDHSYSYRDTYKNTWSFHTDTGSRSGLRLYAKVGYNNNNYTYYSRQSATVVFFWDWGGGGGTYHNIGTHPQASIGVHKPGGWTCTINGVTFTWDKSVNWEW